MASRLFSWPGSVAGSVLTLAVLALLAAGSTVASAQQAPSPWERVRDDGGVLVHRRKVPGSSLHEFRGRGLVGAPMAKVIAVAQDSDRRTEWMDRCVEARTLEKPTQKSQIAYNRTKGSGLVSDRDAVIYGKAIFDIPRKEVRFEFHAVTYDKVPPRRGVVRMPALKGHWIFQPVPGDPGKTRVEYQVHADPGGYIPTFLVNLISREIPHKTIVLLRRQVQRASYAELEKAIAALPEFQQIAQ
jgi:hypothetical protein